MNETLNYFVFHLSNQVTRGWKDLILNKGSSVFFGWAILCLALCNMWCPCDGLHTLFSWWSCLAIFKRSYEPLNIQFMIQMEAGQAQLQSQWMSQRAVQCHFLNVTSAGGTGGCSPLWRCVLLWSLWKRCLSGEKCRMLHRKRHPLSPLWSIYWLVCHL